MNLCADITLNRGSFLLNVKLEFSAGITAVFGHSGAGKSSLLHCLAGLVQPDRGYISIDGKTLFCSTNKINIPTHKRNIGVVFQDSLLFPHLSVGKNLQYGQKGCCSDRKYHFEKVASILEIAPLLNRRVTNLSGGEKKRVALARAILAQPSLLLLDEPFSGLDQGLKDQIMMYLHRLHKALDIPLVLISHCTDEIAELAQEVIFMENGCLLAQGRLGSGKNSKSGCLCQHHNQPNMHKVKNWLIKNHSLQLDNYRHSI